MGKNKKDAVSGSSSTGPSRPANAFLIFRNEYLESIRQSRSSINVTTITQEAQRLWKSMDDSAKQKYKDLYNDRRTEWLEAAPNPIGKIRGKASLGTRCSPKRFVHFMTSLDEDQRRVVVEIGFGSLLQMRCTSLCVKLCAWLVDHIDVHSRSLRIGSSVVPITPAAVSTILGLRSEGPKVVIDGPIEQLAQLRASFTFDRHGIALNDIESRLATLGSGHAFQQAFVLFLVGCLLCPGSNPHVKLHFLHAVANISMVGQYNWGAFVLDVLFNEIVKYREKKKTNIGGCLLFLQLFYYEVVRVGDIESSRPTPRLGWWDDNRVKAREKAEKSVGGYGNGEVVALTVHAEEGDRDVDEGPIPGIDPASQEALDRMRASLRMMQDEYKMAIAYVSQMGRQEGPGAK